MTLLNAVVRLFGLRKVLSGLCALSLLMSFGVLPPTKAAAQQTQCAEVQLGIVQELSFERQAFDARGLITDSQIFR